MECDRAPWEPSSLLYLVTCSSFGDNGVPRVGETDAVPVDVFELTEDLARFEVWDSSDVKDAIAAPLRFLPVVEDTDAEEVAAEEGPATGVAAWEAWATILVLFLRAVIAVVASVLAVGSRYWSCSQSESGHNQCLSQRSLTSGTWDMSMARSRSFGLDSFIP